VRRARLVRRMLEDDDAEGKIGRKSGRAWRKNTTRHRGSLAEMQFMIEAARRGFGVAKPFGDYERYDVILDAGCACGGCR